MPEKEWFKASTAVIVLGLGSVFKIVCLLGFSSRVLSHRSRHSSFIHSCFFFLLLPITSSAYWIRISFKSLAIDSTSSDIVGRAANLPPIVAWITSSIDTSCNFSRSNRILGLLGCFWAFSLSLKAQSTRSWSLPISAPGNVLIWALFMLDLKCCGVNIKSVWLCVTPSAECQVVFLDGLCQFGHGFC